MSAKNNLCVTELLELEWTEILSVNMIDVYLNYSW